MYKDSCVPVAHLVASKSSAVPTGLLQFMGQGLSVITKKPSALVIKLCRLKIANFRDFYIFTGCIYFKKIFFVRLHLLTNLEIGFYVNFIPKHQACQTLLQVTRPVVLWLKEMVMMVFRRGSESNIKSDLGI